MNLRQQHKRIAATEKRWAADALRDAKYNAAQAKRDYRQGNRALGKDACKRSGMEYVLV